MELNKEFMSFDCILFDLDDTLYSSTAGIGQACRKNIEEFLAMKCGVNEERAASLRVELFRTYGSSLTGLLALGYDVHPEEYHSYVHGRLPYDNIQPDPQLRKLLLSIPQQKLIFTNSDWNHAKKALEKLGIEEEIFKCIICFETLNPHLFIDNNTSVDVFLKPSTSAFESAMRIAGSDPLRTLFLDDSERNIAAGKALGLHTALDRLWSSRREVGKRVKIEAADYLVDEMSSLRQIIPEIWGEINKHKNNMKVMGSELDSVRATKPIEA